MQKATAFGTMLQRKQWARVQQKLNVPFIMKVSIVVVMSMLLSAQLLIARDGFGQPIDEKQITLELRDVSLRNALNRIEKLSGFRLAYILEQVAKYKNINLEKETRSVAATLQLILSSTQLDFKQDNNTILIYPKGKISISNNSITDDEPANQKLLGRVTNEKGDPVSGVSVYVKGSPSIGTVTDEKGAFKLEVPDNAVVLVFSSVSTETLEVNIAGKTEINASLKTKTIQQEEVVVVGYGTQKKRDLTGAISSVSHDQMNLGGTTSNVAQSIQGRAAGVQVSQTNAAPGGQTIIRIRGGNSIKSTNEPLYVVDGFPSETGIDINPNDVEDIQILKDASAAAIYGARGANGVVMITTKRGKAGKNIIQYEGYYGVQNFSKKPELMTAKENMTVANAKANEQGNPDEYSAAELASGIDNNWFNLTTRKGTVQNHDINFRGGNEATRISLSGNYFKQEGILKNTDYNRYSGRLNVDHELNKHFKVGANIYAARSFSHFKTYDGNIVPSNVMFGILNTSPAIPAYNSDGSFGTRKGRDNPLAWLLAPTDHQYNNKLSANGYAEYEIIKGLSARINGGTEQMTTKIGTYLPTTLLPGAKVKGQASVRDQVTTRNLVEAYMTYKKKFADVHNVNIVAGVSYQKDLFDDHYTQVQKFTTDQYLYYNLNGAAEKLASASSRSETKIASFYTRLNYSYKDKYLATFTLRRDGSSNFGPNNRYGYFPSGSIAWRLNDEQFIRDLNVFSSLKLRASYGVTGNDRIPPYSYMATFGPTNVTLDGINSYGGVIATRAANPNLKWESTEQLDIGLDMGIANNRITATIDYYRKKTNDLLLDIPIGQWWGFSTQTVNAGAIENKGIELSITTENINTNNFRWNTAFNFAYNKQKCLDLGGRSNIITRTANPDGNVGQADFTKLEPGKELSMLYGYIYEGVIKTGETYSPQPLSKPGDPKFRDMNKDGQITAADQTYLGNANPHYLAAINNDFYYKGIELSIFFQGAFDYNLYNMNGLLLETNAGKDVLKRWTPTNQNTDVPRNGYFTSKYGGYINSRFVEDASYLRCKMITLGYNIPVPKKIINNLKVYASLQNAFTITKYNGTDPEVNTNGGRSLTGSTGTVGANLASGLDFNAFPAFRTITFGVKANF